MINGGGRGGFSRSQKQTITIAAGQNSHATAIDLGKNYAFLVIASPLLTGVPAATSLTIDVDIESDTAIYNLYTANDSTQKWSKVLPTTGSMYLRVEGADLARYIKLKLSANATGAGVTFDVWGFDGAQ